jgi:hypothetical protein
LRKKSERGERERDYYGRHCALWGVFHDFASFVYYALMKQKRQGGERIAYSIK